MRVTKPWDFEPPRSPLPPPGPHYSSGSKSDFRVGLSSSNVTPIHHESLFQQKEFRRNRITRGGAFAPDVTLHSSLSAAPFSISCSRIYFTSSRINILVNNDFTICLNLLLCREFCYQFFMVTLIPGHREKYSQSKSCCCSSISALSKVFFARPFLRPYPR